MNLFNTNKAYLLTIILSLMISVTSSSTFNNITSTIERSPRQIITEDEAYNFRNSNSTPRKGHIVYTLVAFISFGAISYLFASRLHLVLKYRAMNLIRFILVSVYITALGMIVSLGTFINSWDFSGQRLCRTSVIICLTFYIANKALVYVFLIERIHQIREISRRYDYLWALVMIVILAGFIAIAVFAFLDPVHDISGIDGKCRIGLSSTETIILLVYDVGTNTLLAGVFLYQSYQWVGDLPLKKQIKILMSFIPNALERLPATTSLRDFKVQLCHVMMSKSLVGAVAMILPTLANLLLLYEMNGHERGWLCFTTCTLDITWSVIVVHWLTNHPAVDLVDNPVGRRNSTHLPAGDGSYLEMN